MTKWIVAFMCLWLVTTPLHAQSLCADCLHAADQEMRQCLNNAIGPNERVACLDTQQAQMSACSNNECKVEREERAAITEQQSVPTRPGLGLYTPTEAEWLAVVMRAGLRREPTPDLPYSLDIVLAGPDTLQIVVQYRAPLTRDSLGKPIESAREAIRAQARSYGWDKWVKVRETVELLPGK